jgi:Probable Zinc-ribbon domain
MRETLAVVHPELVTEWHPVKNGALTPHSINRGSKQKIWWQCNKHAAHVWQAAVYSRSKGSGCPFCSGRVPTSTNSFGVCYPLLAAEWHLTKNDGLTPYEVKPHSDKKVWWQCKKDSSHEWPAAIKDRVHGNGCPLCRGGIPTTTTCLSSLHPRLALEWHPTRNEPLTPANVVPGGHQRCGGAAQKTLPMSGMLALQTEFLALAARYAPTYR